MNLRSYLDDRGRGGAAWLAEELDISPSFLSQMASGKAPIGPARCVEIERVTFGAVTRKDLRPHDYHLIWPDLADPSSSPAAQAGA